MKVLIGCESSGVVREAFRARGHDAWSCDILPPDDRSPHHFQMDVRDAIKHVAWDLAIFHPPCTRLCNSGVRWLHERNLWDDMRDGARLFLDCLDSGIPRVAVENPVMHKYARDLVGRGPDFTVQPWQFGDPAKKRTCFWTKGLHPLKPTSDMTALDATPDCHKCPPGPDRWKIRSKTYQGIANAMAKQWGET
jgi:hypothetical protein